MSQARCLCEAEKRMVLRVSQVKAVEVGDILKEVLLSDMVDKWTSPFQTHFGPVFRDEAVQRDLPFPEPGSICLFLRAPSPISPVLATFEIQREKGKPPYSITSSFHP